MRKSKTETDNCTSLCYVVAKFKTHSTFFVISVIIFVFFSSIVVLCVVEWKENQTLKWQLDNLKLD